MNLSVPVFTRRCACCQQPGVALCRPCRFALVSARSVQLAPGAGVGAEQPVHAALVFDGAVRQAILSLKFGNRRAIARHLALLTVRRLGLDHRAARTGGPARPAFDLVTWAPTSPARARRRGYDQAQLLARHIARELGVPCRRLLWRQHGAPQQGRSRQQRLQGPGFRARPAARPLRVLVVDDVVTTGATLHAAASALRAAGVGHVTAVAVAATPAPALRAPRRVSSPAASPTAPLASVVPLRRAS